MVKRSNYEPVSTREMISPPNKIMFSLLHLTASEPTGTKMLLLYSYTNHAFKPSLPVSLPSVGGLPRVGSVVFPRQAVLSAALLKASKPGARTHFLSPLGDADGGWSDAPVI